MFDQDQFLGDDQERAICIACGESKMEPFHRSEKCGLDPRDEDLVRSTYLSVYRFAGDSELAEKFSFELRDIKQYIISGNKYHYEASEIERVRDQIDTWLKEGNSASWSIVLLLFIVPAIGIGVLIYLILR